MAIIAVVITSVCIGCDRMSSERIVDGALTRLDPSEPGDKTLFPEVVDLPWIPPKVKDVSGKQNSPPQFPAFPFSNSDGAEKRLGLLLGVEREEDVTTLFSSALGNLEKDAT